MKSKELVSPLSFDSHSQDTNLDLAWPSAIFWEKKTQPRDELPWSRGNAEHCAAGAVADHPAFVNQELMESEALSHPQRVPWVGLL